MLVICITYIYKHILPSYSETSYLAVPENHSLMVLPRTQSSGPNYFPAIHREWSGARIDSKFSQI